MYPFINHNQNDVISKTFWKNLHTLFYTLKDFEKEYLDNIRYYCLVMSEDYIRNHFADIKSYAGVIENRLDDEWCTLESVLKENSHFLELAINHNVNYLLIDDKYEIDINL